MMHGGAMGFRGGGKGEVDGAMCCLPGAWQWLQHASVC